MTRKHHSIESRLQRNSATEPNSGCWLWLGSLDPNGYGVMAFNRVKYRAHRISYEFYREEIPAGKVLDHLCRVRSCINPDHLEAVTLQENIARGMAGQATGARHRAKTHCAHGHPYSEDNTYVDSRGWRQCRECHRVRQSAINQRRRR